MRILLLLLACVVALNALPAFSADQTTRATLRPHDATRGSSGANDVIVVLDDGADPVAAAAVMGVTVTHVYRHVFMGFAGTLPAAEVSAAQAMPAVRDVFEDGRVHAESQTLSTGVRRVGTPAEPDGEHLAIASPIDADIAILDTGVSRVADLTVAGGTSCVKGKAKTSRHKKHKKHKKGRKGKKGNKRKHHKKKRHKKRQKKRGSWVDDNGHGTHTAGIAAAIDNDEDIAGVAPGARIWAVKVLDGKGDGSFSNVICGLDWVVKHKQTIDVVNLSLGGDGEEKTCQMSALHRAVCQTVAAGIPVVVAAGNQGIDASERVPASYDEVITVSAMSDTDGESGGLGPSSCTHNADDRFSSFSNFGADIDIAAPGDCILSILPSGELKAFSGTSEATPHVTGAVARYIAAYLAEHGVRPTPAQTRAWLLSDGSKPQSSPEGFSGDPDGFQEPMLWLGDVS